MSRLLVLATLAAVMLPAQEVVKIAPEKEADLRGRVAKFWDGFVSAKYRASDAYVSAESKEEFFSWPKKKIRGYTIEKIYYSEGGKAAKVVTYVDTTLAMMGVGSMDIKQPVETWWREEEGTWFWFMPKNQMRDTPFGKMESNAQSGETPLIPTGQMDLRNPDLKALMAQVRPDRQDVSFVLGEEKEERVKFTNAMQGVVILTIDSPPAEDITFELSSKTIPRQGTADLIVHYKPTKKADPDAEPITKIVRVGVAQTGKMYAIKVVVAPKKADK